MCLFPPIAATGQGIISNEMIDTTDNQILILADDSTLDLGKTTQITIILDTAPDGLSGYNLTVRLTNPAVAEIVDVQFPVWAMLRQTVQFPEIQSGAKQPI